MSEEDVLVVTCPVCGKVTQKSIFTYSEVRCQRCHRDLTAFADLGVVVGIDMNKKRSKEDVDRLERYMTHLVRLDSRILRCSVDIQEFAERVGDGTESSETRQNICSYL